MLWGKKKIEFMQKNYVAIYQLWKKMEQLTMLNIKNKCNKIYVNTI